MNKDEKILKEINRYFGFLVAKGYKIRDTEFRLPNGNWQVSFESSKCVIQILSDRDEIAIDLLPLGFGQELRFGIKAMVYFVTSRENFVDFFMGNTFWGKNRQYEILAKLLKDHIDMIELYFGNNFEKYRHELSSAQEKYNQELLRRHKNELFFR